MKNSWPPLLSLEMSFAHGKCHLAFSQKKKKKNLIFLPFQNSGIWWLFHTTGHKEYSGTMSLYALKCNHLTLGFKLQPCNLPGGEMRQQVIIFTQVQTTEQVMAQSGLFSWFFLWGKQKKARILLNVNWLVSSRLLAVCAQTFSYFFPSVQSINSCLLILVMKSQKAKCRAPI